MSKDQNEQLFFEELGNPEEYVYQESLDPEIDTSLGGLTNENVLKLSEDLRNPLPPSDSEAY
jgi:hypothetical protein